MPRDPDLIRRIGAATAQEVAATGADWTFAPTLAVPRDVRWGRSYEGFAAEPEVVASYAGPMTLGVQGVLSGRADRWRPDTSSARPKHFLADGGTEGGKDQGDAVISETDLIRLHAQGYPPAIDAGILTVMASFSSWNGVKHSANQSLLTDVLKGRMGFQGFVVGDWNAHGEVPGCRNDDCPDAINAGLDMYMAPDSWRGLYEHTLAEAKSGRIPMVRLDDAVRRILRVKVKAGLFEKPRFRWRGRFDLPGLARPCGAGPRGGPRSRLVLLKNNGSVLPITAVRQCAGGRRRRRRHRQTVRRLDHQLAGPGQQEQRLSPRPVDLGGHRGRRWALVAATPSWRPTDISATGVYFDVAIVVFGEKPYAEFQGDIATVDYQPEGKRDLALLKSLKAEGVPVVAVFLSGSSPLWTNSGDQRLRRLCRRLAAGHGRRRRRRRADCPGRTDRSATISPAAWPYPWPRRADQAPLDPGAPGYDPQFPYGYGLSYARGAAVAMLSEDPGATVAGPNVDHYFAKGHAIAPWRLSSSGDVTVQGDRRRSAGERAHPALWSGASEGVLAFTGPATDLSRQTTGAMALSIRYRLDTPASGPASLSMACGPGCEGRVDVSSALAAPAGPQWRTLNVRLSCFKAVGALMDRVDGPLKLSTSGRLAIAFSDIGLVVQRRGRAMPTIGADKGPTSAHSGPRMRWKSVRKPYPNECGPSIPRYRARAGL